MGGAISGDIDVCTPPSPIKYFSLNVFCARSRSVSQSRRGPRRYAVWFYFIVFWLGLSVLPRENANEIIVSQIKTAASVWCKKNPRAGLIIIISSHIPSIVSTGQLLLSIDEPVVSRSVYRTLLKRPSHGWPRVIPSGINWDAHGLENPPWLHYIASSPPVHPTLALPDPREKKSYEKRHRLQLSTFTTLQVL